MHLLNDAGNTFDAFFLASILALKNTRLPEVSMTRDKIRVDDSKLKYVNVHHIPVCTTFYFFKDLSTPILDVNSKEEMLSTSRLSIVMNIFEDICGMTTLGSLDIENAPDQRQLLKFMKIAMAKTKQITNLIREKWANKHNEYSLLDISHASAAPKASA
jgi:exosome complex component RRP45